MVGVHTSVSQMQEPPPRFISSKSFSVALVEWSPGCHQHQFEATGVARSHQVTCAGAQCHRESGPWRAGGSHGSELQLAKVPRPFWGARTGTKKGIFVGRPSGRSTSRFEGWGYQEIWLLKNPSQEIYGNMMKYANYASGDVLVRFVDVSVVFFFGVTRKPAGWWYQPGRAISLRPDVEKPRRLISVHVVPCFQGYMVDGQCRLGQCNLVTKGWYQHINNVCWAVSAASICLLMDDGTPSPMNSFCVFFVIQQGGGDCSTFDNIYVYIYTSFVHTYLIFIYVHPLKVTLSSSEWFWRSNPSTGNFSHNNQL